VHVPGVALQTPHPPLHGCEQQTPFAQLPLAHAASGPLGLQGCPLASAQAPDALQMFGATQLSGSVAFLTWTHAPVGPTQS
jgi:hypothetical protein